MTLALLLVTLRAPVGAYKNDVDLPAFNLMIIKVSVLKFLLLYLLPTERGCPSWPASVLLLDHL